MNAFLLLWHSATGSFMLLSILGNTTIFIFLLQKDCEFTVCFIQKYPRQSIKAQDYEKLFSSN